MILLREKNCKEIFPYTLTALDAIEMVVLVLYCSGEGDRASRATEQEGSRDESYGGSL